MPYAKYAAQEVEARGEAMYARLRAAIEPGNVGSFLVIDVESGDYEVDAHDVEATARLLARRPDAILYGVRIGHAAAYRLGLLAAGERE